MGGVIYLFGGYSSVDGEEYFNDLWAYDPVTNGWIPVQLSSEPAPGRYAHGSVALPETQEWGERLVVAFGGGSEGDRDDSWIYDAESGVWDSLSSNGAERPVSRTDLGMMTYEEQFYLYGGRGCCGSGVYGDLWLYDLSDGIWEERQAYEPRYGHSVALYDDKVYVYGGMGTLLHDDMAMYDPTEDSWMTLEQPGEVPPPRTLHAAASNGSTMWIIGGVGEDGKLSDTWEYDFASNTWEQKAEAPLLSRAGAATASADPGAVFLFGGLDNELNPTSELWRYDADLDEWEELAPMGARPPSLATEYELTARPNPFQTQTTFFNGLRSPPPSEALLIYDVSGRVIRKLPTPDASVPNEGSVWDGTDDMGRKVVPGVYLIRPAGHNTLRIVKLP
jgi:N-acetylneuraminic acid mutarotase